MLASIIANLQNVPQAEVRHPTINIDRGGGGPIWGQRYDIVDILAASQTFPEIAGEDPVARAVRRTRWIGEALPKIREARDRRETGTFLAGLQFGYAAGYEAAATERASSSAWGQPSATERASSSAWGRSRATALDFARAEPMPAKSMDRGEYERSGSGVGAGLVVAALAIGAIGAVVLLNRRRSR
jgi:hypothetical protein